MFKALLSIPSFFWGRKPKWTFLSLESVKTQILEIARIEDFLSFSGELRDHQLANGLGLNENQKDAAFLYLINQWVKKFQEKKDWPSENGAPYAITIPLQYNSSTGNSLIEQIHTFLTDAKKESEIKYNALLDILPMTAELLHNYAPK